MLAINTLQEKFVKTVTKRFKRTRKGSFRVKAGFYTEQAMKDTLNYNPSCPQHKVCSKPVIDYIIEMTCHAGFQLSTAL